MFRILGGVKRGKKLKGPTGLEFRPTTGRVKSYLFSFFDQDIPGSTVLDLFSGTGSFGLEALSRSASDCTFVENNRNTIQLLKNNIRLCGFENRCRLIAGDVFSVLQRMESEKRTFDFILADPPFKESLREKIARTVDLHRVLKQNGVLVIEHEFHDADAGSHGLKLLKQKRFGHCIVSFYGYLDFNTG
jgi:16S rRNA (guanine966-N2)-methyltransferase